jgi:hypothetical protein
MKCFRGLSTTRNVSENTNLLFTWEGTCLTLEHRKKSNEGAQVSRRGTYWKKNLAHCCARVLSCATRTQRQGRMLLSRAVTSPCMNFRE